MKLWIDDVRPAPEGYTLCKTVHSAKYRIEVADSLGEPIELIDTDHDAGDYAIYGGDYIEILNWLEATGRSYPIRIHSMNPVGRQNMMAICEKNNWEVIY